MKWIPLALLIGLISSCLDWQEVEPLPERLIEGSSQDFLLFTDTTMNYDTYEVSATWSLDSSRLSPEQLNSVAVELKTNKRTFIPDSDTVTERYSGVNTVIPIEYELRLILPGSGIDPFVADQITFLFD
ncbi:MAG: hypothetical protein AAF741_03270 [Bacteroidota bacterium]